MKSRRLKSRRQISTGLTQTSRLRRFSGKADSIRERSARPVSAGLRNLCAGHGNNTAPGPLTTPLMKTPTSTPGEITWPRSWACSRVITQKRSRPTTAGRVISQILRYGPPSAAARAYAEAITTQAGFGPGSVVNLDAVEVGPASGFPLWLLLGGGLLIAIVVLND